MKSGLSMGLAAMTLLSAATFAAPAPKLSIPSLKQLPMVDRTPYDTHADAAKEVDAALARAKKNGKRVLIDMGGNWCPDCLILANLMELPEMKAFINKHFEVVKVDIGRFDKNQDIPARYGVKGRLKGVPAVLVVTADGKRVNPLDKVSALADARHMNAQGIANWLAQWTN